MDRISGFGPDDGGSIPSELVSGETGFREHFAFRKVFRNIVLLKANCECDDGDLILSKFSKENFQTDF